MNFFSVGNSEDELDECNINGTIGDDDSMDSTMLPQNSSPNLSSEPLNLMPSENHGKYPDRISPDYNERQSDSENLRIRSADQLLSPESLMRQEQMKDGETGEDLGIVPQDLEVKKRGDGVWAKREVQKGTRYGPFLGKWLSEPMNLDYAWEVSRW